ncbi:primase-helicase family protein [Sulfuriroseicoccus oceanibius]|uniref:NrS-1 polymerase-like helicase domain-containing protein n=1 Tax=Sulfuriroseicoccus oceanibius TaxID=2707525 RepID=A0A7T7EZ35_9BACT|nr:primase-helicase family protein [Sulfuriroseicoccus oceanibius]QQL43709.1 hypothetical protein G3M56_007295 [Sulfuriroseicoccus oceanibius]
MLNITCFPDAPSAENPLLRILRAPMPASAELPERGSGSGSPDLTEEELEAIRRASYDKANTYYNGETQQFYVRVSGDRYQVRSERELRRFMEASGVVGKEAQNSDLVDIQLTHRVEYAHPLSGHDAGVVDLGNTKLLITNSPPRIVPQAGDWPTIHGFLRALFGAEDQVQVFKQWLKLGYELIHCGGGQKQSQLLCLIGAAGCGKSQLSRHIIGPVLGRSGSGVELYSNTDFNASVFALELLELDDVPIGRGLGGRDRFMAQTKEALVANSLFCNPKGVNGYQVSPKWRLVMMMNDDPELLEEFPLNVSGWDDKVIMHRCQDASQLLGSSTDEMARFDEAVRRELPAFIHHLVNWECDPCYRSSPGEGTRFGVDSYKHPALVREVFENSKEAQMEQLLIIAHRNRVVRDALKSDGQADPTASYWWNHSDFRSCMDHSDRERADRLVPDPQRFGTMMARLSRSSELQGRLERRHGNRRNEWEFTPNLVQGVLPETDPSTGS